MADNSNLNEENSFYLDPNILIRRSYSYTHYMFYNRSIDTQNNPINRKYIGQFVLGEKIGQGTFGIVVLGTHQITGEKVAVKILDKEKILQETDKSRLEREIKILKKMRHNNIVHLYDVKETPTSLYIIMEYICGKELFEYIISNKRLQELEACRFYQQIISGIEYLGKIKVVHRDIKPENLLLDNKNNIKIVDFGLSNSYPKNELLITACGSPCYAAPEMINGERYYGLKADIWSSGIVLYAMLCGYLPFEEVDNEKLYKKITEGKFKTPNFLSDSAKDFLHRILNVDPRSRITIPQMKKHPWFNLINPKINMSEGLLLNKVIVPIDENIVYKMVNEYKFNGEEIRTNLLLNNHNHITTTYFLILNQKIRNGEKTIGNMKSKEFIKYIHSPTNLLSHYGNDMKRIINARAKLVEKEEKEKKMKEKNSVNGMSGETRPGSSGIMKLGSSMEKIKRKDKRDTSVKQRKKKEIDKNENHFKTTSVEKNQRNKRNKLQNKYIPKSVDTKIKKRNENKEKIKEKTKILSISPDIKIKLEDIKKRISKKRNIEMKNKHNITKLKTEEKEHRNKIEIEEKSKNINDSSEKKENRKSKKYNKLNKKAITNKTVIKKNKFDITLIDNNKKEKEKNQKIKILAETKNITEKRMINNNKNKKILNDKEEEEERKVLINTNINKYVNMSKLMRRIKGYNNEQKSSSKKKRNILDEEYSVKIPKINITQRQENDIINNNKDEKDTDRYENENKSYVVPKKRNIITSIYNCDKNINNVRNKRAVKNVNEKMKKKFIDTSISFDKTKDENDIEKINKDNILITEQANHIEENEDSESSNENDNKDGNQNENKDNKDGNQNDNKDNKDDNKNKEIEKEVEEYKRKEKDIKYLKLKSKHKQFNIVKNTNKDELNNNTHNKNFKKTKTKNMENPIKNSKINKLKNIITGNEKIILNPQKKIIQNNKNIEHYTTINDYKKYLNYSKNVSLTERNQDNNNSNNSIDNEVCQTFDSNSKSHNSRKNKSKKNDKFKNTELSFIYDENDNNNLKVFDLNSINFYENYNSKEIKEKIKRELDNKKVKYTLKKNKYCCYYKNENKFDIDIYSVNEVKNVYIIKYIKKYGNTNVIKDIFKYILLKLNSR